MGRALLALAALSTALAMPLQAAEPVVLKPLGPWNVDFGDDACRLQRLFGSAEDKHVLVFTQYWPSERAGLTLAGSALGKLRTVDRTSLRYNDAQEPLRAPAFEGNFGDIGQALIFPNVSLTASALENREPGSDGPFTQMDVALGRTVRFVAVTQGSREVRYETGALDKAFEVLNKCTLDLLTKMGLDAQKHVTATSEARWINREALVRRITAQYPGAARGEQGIMRMRVIVGVDGKVEECRILKATATQFLESPACEVMQRAQFEPARDAAGEPFRSLFATTITYRIG
ncbi:TonB family protein [Erythrobacter sp. CCH5-A1]|jgi:TonB family protein|uniref:TonB family protein n=1 Tax=Erythrobacter sp. CCH5-A1 TaxID=1768792 RepID=UPI000829B2B9|nr:TonB family protein [Erythrobacter sp. CCH5-A1]